MAATAVTTRLNFRVRPEVEVKLRAAAEAVGMSLTDFVLGAATVRAEEVLVSNTVVPEEFFNHLLDAMSGGWPTGGKLAEDARMARRVVRQA